MEKFVLLRGNKLGAASSPGTREVSPGLQDMSRQRVSAVSTCSNTANQGSCKPRKGILAIFDGRTPNAEISEAERWAARLSGHIRPALSL